MNGGLTKGGAVDGGGPAIANGALHKLGLWASLGNRAIFVAFTVDEGESRRQKAKS